MNKKGYIAALTAVFLAVSMCSSAFAEEQAPGGDGKQTVRLESMDMSLELPEGWTAFTSELTAEDPLFRTYGLEGKERLSQWKEQGVLIDALNFDMEFTVVNAGEGHVTHLSQYTDEQLQEIMEAVTEEGLAEQLKNLKEEKTSYSQVDKVAVDYHDILRKEQASYLLGDSRFERQGQTLYGLQYYTIVNGRILTFNFYSLDGAELKPEQKTAAGEIMDTVGFGHLDKPKATGRPKWVYAVDLLIGGVIGMAVYPVMKRKKRKLR